MISSHVLVGDRGFDPLGLAKPSEFYQVELDELDQNAATNKAGGIVGEIKKNTKAPEVDSGNQLAPYSNVRRAHWLPR